MDRQTALASLELHLNKLFSGRCSNEDIQQIQQSLDSFAKQKGVWRDALFFITNSKNDSVSMYSLTIIEGVIKREWSGLSAHEKLELRTTLYHWILEKHNNIPFYIRNKAVQLIVYIARSDWPASYSDFYSTVLSLVTSQSTLGLLYLLTLSEEFVSSKNDLLSERKEELRLLLLQQVPQTFSILTNLLMLAWKRYSSAATPPPSPNNDVKFEGLNETAEISRLTLQCLTQFFSWVPIVNINPMLLELIFNFARIGANESVPQLQTSEPSVSTAALGAINEILYRNYIPVDFEDFLIMVFKQTNIVLQSLVERENVLARPCPRFIEKTVELVHLLVSSHLSRIEKRQDIGAFLMCFFKLTFDQVDWNGYTRCLETWLAFLEHIKRSGRDAYASCLVPLSERVLDKVLYMKNGEKLIELDDDSLDGEMENEFEKLCHLSFDIFLPSADLTKQQTLSLLTEPFQRCLSSYESLAAYLKTNNGILPVQNKHQLKELNCFLKDLATLLQLMGRLSELHLKHPLPDSQSIIETLLRVSSHSGCLVKDPDANQLMININCQCLSSLQSWSFWLSDYIRSETPPEAITRTINSFIDSSVNALNSSNFTKLSSIGLDLLSAIVSSVRSPLLWTSSSWNRLFVSLHDFNHLPPQNLRRLLKTVLGASVLTWRDCNVEEQHWDERQARFQVDAERVVGPARDAVMAMVRSPGATTSNAAKELVVRTLQLLSDLAAMAREETTPSKRATSAIVIEWVDLTLGLMAVCSNEEIIEAIIQLYLCTFDSLLHQMGTSQAEKIMRSLLEIYSQQNIELALKQENPHGIKAIEQLLKLFQIIVKEPAAPFRKFLPQILSICLNNVHPFVLQAAGAEDMKEAFYQLLNLILSHHWRFFFKGSVLSAYQSQGFGHEEVENRAHFLMILNAFGQSFVSAELSVFKQNLEAMQGLNTKWKLYSKNIFRDIAPHFIHTLLNVMINGFHDLYKEDIAFSIHAMALPDIELFFRETLADYLTRCEGLDDNQRLLLKNNFSAESDLPTFCKNLERFVHDLQCHRTANGARV